jgi:hypothetical protein
MQLICERRETRPGFFELGHYETRMVSGRFQGQLIGDVPTEYLQQCLKELPQDEEYDRNNLEYELRRRGVLPPLPTLQLLNRTAQKSEGN